MADDHDADDVVVCANPDCRVAEDGKCVEGFELNACPHYGHLPKAVDDEEITTEAPESDEAVGLPAADTLTPEQVSGLLRAGETRVIAIIGPSDAGKTSLIASLYDLFQEGSVAGIDFARSRSLHAFEHACHDARAASRRDVPHINRTPRGEVRFYHLDIGGGAAGDALALALGDRAGEEYRGAADDTSVVAVFPEIQRADSLTLLVDGERLLDAGARHNLRQEVTMILQALIDGGGVKTGQRLALVLTKVDAVQASPNRARAEADFEALCANLGRLFGTVFTTIEAFRTAASPKNNTIARGTGVPELLTFWLGAATAAPTLPSHRPTFARAFARLRPTDEPEADT
jgi:hypothetical protein